MKSAQSIPHPQPPPQPGGGGPMPNAGAPMPFTLPPTFPPGVNPETYKVEEVTRLLKSAAYFPIFNVANPASPNKPVPLIPGIDFLLIAVEVNEALHRFEVRVEEPSCDRGLRGTNTVGEPVANVHIRWTPIPEGFEAAPNKLPPTTLLNPFCSQRFTMLDGQLSFMDRNKSGFRAFGAGRTFPSSENGKRILRIGAVIEILEGLGEFQGLTGAFVINGWIAPPHDLALNLLVRVMDPEGRLTSREGLNHIQPAPDPDPTAVFMYFMGEADPDKPVTLNLSPDGRILGSNVAERLRLVNIGFDLTPVGPRSITTEGPIVGTVTANLHFDPHAATDVSPIQTTNGVFTFFDHHGQTLGTVSANMIEGRAMKTNLEGAPMPVFRFGGFGPILGGTGYFKGADGMMSMNSAISVFPRTLSNLYVLRFYDPTGRFRAEMCSAWS